jgi:hypothetical protein
MRVLSSPVMRFCFLWRGGLGKIPVELLEVLASFLLGNLIYLRGMIFLLLFRLVDVLSLAPLAGEALLWVLLKLVIVIDIMSAFFIVKENLPGETLLEGLTFNFLPCFLATYLVFPPFLVWGLSLLDCSEGKGALLLVLKVWVLNMETRDLGPTVWSEGDFRDRSLDPFLFDFLIWNYLLLFCRLCSSIFSIELESSNCF